VQSVSQRSKANLRNILNFRDGRGEYIILVDFDDANTAAKFVFKHIIGSEPHRIRIEF
jgi:hypothetical protein